MEDDKIYYDYYEYVSPYNILVVSNDGEILEIECPFKAQSKVTFPEIKPDESVWVDKVQIAQDRKDVFIIDGNAYHVEHFRVIP